MNTRALLPLSVKRLKFTAEHIAHASADGKVAIA